MANSNREGTDAFLIVSIVIGGICALIPMFAGCWCIYAILKAGNQQQQQNVYITPGHTPNNQNQLGSNPNTQPVNGTFGASATGNPL